MTVKRLVTPGRFIGLSTDTKPTDGATSVRPGATFYAYDTNLMYITYDGTNWVTKASLDTIGVLAANSGVDIGDVDILSIAAGSNRIGTVIPGTPFEVRVTKNILVGGAYVANDVVSESTTNGTGTAWTFADMAAANGGYGVIDTATIVSQTPNITPRFLLILFNATPTGELDDNAANTSPVDGDLAKILPPIDFPSLYPAGTSANSSAVASSSTVGNLPLLYKCAAGTTSIYGISVTRDIFTQTAADNLTIILAGRHL